MAYVKKSKKNDPSFKRSRRSKNTVEPAVLQMKYLMPLNEVAQTIRYLDIFADLSKANRKLMRQGYQLAVGSITVNDDLGTPRSVDMSFKTAGNNWITHNSFVKGHALWTQMNKEVLEDNPSIRGTWHDYKIRLIESHISSNTLSLRDGSGNAWPVGAEWRMSTYVVPQHDVDAAGNVLPAEEYTACLTGVSDEPNNIISLVQAYENSRATVQDTSPNVPVALPNSFYLRLTDDGSQDPELATIIADDNEKPPYPNTPGTYPGGAAFTSASLVTQQRGIMNEFQPTLSMGGFVAPCGLVQVVGQSATAGNVEIIVNCVVGNYKGVMAVPMGQ